MKIFNHTTFCTLALLITASSFGADLTVSDGDTKKRRETLVNQSNVSEFVGKVAIVPQKSTDQLKYHSCSQDEYRHILSAYSKQMNKEKLDQSDVVRVHYFPADFAQELSPYFYPAISSIMIEYLKQDFSTFPAMILLETVRPKIPTADKTTKSGWAARKNDGDIIEIPNKAGIPHAFQLDQSPFPSDGNVISVISHMQNACWFVLTLDTLHPEKVPEAFANFEEGNEKERLRKHLLIAYPGIKLP